MKGLLKKFTAALAVLSVIISLAVIPSQAQESTSQDSPSQNEVVYYGRGALSKLERADVLLYAYDALVEGVEESSHFITVWDGENAITTDELKMVMDAYLRDHTEHFWLDKTYSLSHPKNNPDIVYDVAPDYILKGEALSVARARFDESVSELLSFVDDGMSDFEKELVLHDKLSEKVRYVDGENAHNAYGAIVEGKAVCEGYAEALKYLLDCVGIESFIMIGSSVNPTTGESEPHGWCAVKLDGVFYHVDPTWNDQENGLFHAYFNVSDVTLLSDHLIDSAEYELPACPSDDMSYFSVMGGILRASEYTYARVAELLTEGEETHIYLPDGVEGFYDWLKDNFSQVAYHMGIGGKVSLSFSAIGNEARLLVSSCTHKNLTFIKYSAPDCETDGNQAYYLCECGKLFSDSFATEEITQKQSVIISASGHDFSVMTETDDYLKQKGSCTAANTYWYACANCGESAKNDPFSAQKFYTGTTFGDHNVSNRWSSEDGVHYHICTVNGCGYKTDEEFCHGGEASCLEPAECEVCGREYGDTLGHDFEDAECVRCGELKSQKAEKAKSESENFVSDLLDDIISGTASPVMYAAVGFGALVLLFIVFKIFKRR